MICKWCKVAIIPRRKTGRGRPPLYCSAVCRLSHGKTKVSRVHPPTKATSCRLCGTDVPPRLIGVPGRNRFYCSDRCRRAFAQSRAQPRTARPKPERHCGVCGISMDQGYKFCSEACRLQATYDRRWTARHQVDNDAKCSICSIVLPHSRKSRRTTYCSDVCANKAWNRIKNPAKRARYKAATIELVDPFRVFDRDGWLCHLCGRATLKSKRGTTHPLAPELDHIVPLSKGGEHSYRNTACSCRRCNSAKGARVVGQLSLLAHV